MNVSFTDNVLVINTGVSKADLGGKSQAFAKNDKGADAFVLRIREGEDGKLDAYSMTCNNVKEDGTLQVVIPVSSGFKVEDIKTIYADALIAAAKYIPQIAEEVASKAAAVDALFQ